MAEIIIYTDGSCNKDNGLGGWGWVQIENGEEKASASGSAMDTTNNRMELQALIEACKYLVENKDPDNTYCLVTDSQYSKNGICDWVHKWKLTGWKTLSGPVKNVDLWKEFYRLFYLELEGSVSISWVKGHSGVLGNEKADSLAEKARSAHQESAAKHTVSSKNLSRLEMLEARVAHLESLMGSSIL